MLTPALKVDPSEVRWHFIADYFDAPISGLAFFRGYLHRFCCFSEDIPDHHVYALHELTPEELANELRVKERFEASVGTHWSFDKEGRPLPAVDPPAGATQKYYQETKATPSPRPSDRPIVAWFDISASSSSPSP
jgi:hypothetical protein